jgi:hypothetical protein
MNRRDLRFGLGYMPRIVIVLAGILISMPIHLVVGMMEGFANGLHEIGELWKIDQKYRPLIPKKLKH